MKSVPITEFRKMLIRDIKSGGSFNLIADGELIAIVVVPISAVKKDQIQALCSQMNAAKGVL